MLNYLRKKAISKLTTQDVIAVRFYISKPKPENKTTNLKIAIIKLIEPKN